jgi:hypothetical protein
MGSSRKLSRLHVSEHNELWDASEADRIINATKPPLLPPPHSPPDQLVFRYNVSTSSVLNRLAVHVALRLRT